MDSKPIQYHWSKYTDLRSIWFGIIGNGGGKGELRVAGEGSKYFGSYIRDLNFKLCGIETVLLTLNY